MKKNTLNNMAFQLLTLMDYTKPLVYVVLFLFVKKYYNVG